jgi:hypothetical protein
VTKRLVELFRVGLFVLAVAGLVLASQKNSAVVGTWKLNVAESNYSSGSAPKSGIRTVEEHENGLAVSYEYVEADGSTIKYGYAATFDGKDYPISGSGTNWREEMLGGAETIALRPSGANVYAGMLKKSGNVVMTTRTVVSKDGKVTTVTANGADAKGQPTKRVSVWEKQ